MTITGTRRVEGYDAGAMLLHWTIAGAILAQLAGGFAMTRLAVVPDAARFAVFQWHKTIGLLVLTLTLARIAWRLLNPPPPPHAPMRRIESVAANAVHLLFYGLMLAVPLAGWTIVSLSPTGIPTLLALSERLPWPHLPLPDTWRSASGERAAATVHAALAYSTAALLVLHVAGALKHSIVDRVPSLSRMAPVGRIRHQPVARRVAVPIGVALVAAFLGSGLLLGRNEGAAVAQADAEAGAPSAAAAASGWTIDKTASLIRFETTFSGKPLAGTAERWTAAIRFDPDDLAAAKATISVDAASIAVPDPFVRSNVPGPDGFDTAKHPTVTVELSSFARAAEGFLARGTLAIRDKRLPVEVPFTFERSADGAAKVAGRASVERLAFGLGVANDPTGQWLGKTVSVSFELRATEAPAAGPAS